MVDLFKDLKIVRKADRMQRNAQARPRDGGGCLSYGHPAPRRNWALPGLLSEGHPYLRLVTQNLEEPNVPRRCTPYPEAGTSIGNTAGQDRSAGNVQPISDLPLR